MRLLLALVLSAALFGAVEGTRSDTADAQTPPPALPAATPPAGDPLPALAQAASEGRLGRDALAAVQSSGTARVIVQLSSGFRPEGQLAGAQAVRNQRAAIQAAQDAVERVLATRNADKLKRFETVPFLAVEVDAGALAALAASPTVTSIVEDKLSAPTLAESIPLIRADQLWNTGITGSGQVVAVLDTGVDKTHPFLAGKVVGEACYSTTYAAHAASTICPGGVQSSIAAGAGVNCALSQCFHGTHVAGIVAGVGGAYSGVAKGAGVISMQVFSRFDSAAQCGGSTPCVLSYDSDQLLALERVLALKATHNIAAVNMSLGGGHYATQAACDADYIALKAAIDNLRAAGIATVIASGNDGYTNGIGGPGCISSAVSVGSVSEAGAVSSFSNSSAYLNLLAPGQVINSATPGGGYGGAQGTSMATPHVAGAWALLKSKCPSATVPQILTALTNTGVSTVDGRNGISKPRIDVLAAANALCSGAQTGTKATLTAPAPGSTLGGGSVTFGWAAGSGAEQYALWVGSTGVGSYNIYSGYPSGTSATISGLPTNGGTVSVRLWTRLAGAWQFNDYSYTAASTALTKATLTSPTPGSTLSGGSVTFGWTVGNGAEQYALWVGSSGAGSSNLYAGYPSGTSTTISGLPTNGGTISVRLWTRLAGAWQFSDYSYTAATAAPTGSKAILTSPTPGSMLGGASVTFGWTAGSGAEQYALWVGSTSVGSYNIYSGYPSGTSATVTGLPTSGGTVSVRLWTKLAGAWQSNDYSYTAASVVAGGTAQLTAPAPGSTLSSSSATFSWTAGGGSEYYLWVGTTGVGSYNLHAQPYSARSATLSGLPTTGGTLYLRLWTKLNGVWEFTDFTYAAARP